MAPRSTSPGGFVTTQVPGQLSPCSQPLHHIQAGLCTPYARLPRVTLSIGKCLVRTPSPSPDPSKGRGDRGALLGVPSECLAAQSPCKSWQGWSRSSASVAEPSSQIPSATQGFHILPEPCQGEQPHLQGLTSLVAAGAETLQGLCQVWDTV